MASFFEDDEAERGLGGSVLTELLVVAVSGARSGVWSEICLDVQLN